MSTGVEATIQRVIESLAEEIKQGFSRPIYFQVMQERGGKVSIRHIQVITPEQLAEMCHVEKRTVYHWIEKATSGDESKRNSVPPIYRAPGTRGVLFDLHESIEWVRGQVKS